MLTTKSERHFFKFHCTIFLVMVSFGIPGATFVFMLLDEYGNDSSLLQLLLYVSILICACVPVYTVIRYYRNTPNIVITPDRISFNGKEFLWDDLVYTQLKGKHPFEFLTVIPMEGARLGFSDGTIKHVYYEMYVNGKLIRTALRQYARKKEPSVTSDTDSSVSIRNALKSTA